MPADIDVLVAGSSPITFPSSYLPFASERSDYNERDDLLTSKPLDFSLGPSYLSRSPPVIGSSPPTHFTFHGRCSSPTLRSVPPPAITLAKNLSQLRLGAAESKTMPVAVPRRPCLVVRCDVLDLPSPNKNKKRVVFADDRGFPLALVRTMTEPSNMPPRWSFEFLSQVTQGACDAAAEPWELTFQQPASDYLDFRRRLDTNNVSLENVIVKEAEQAVIGTVKVRNLAFHKEVFVRMTSDDWETQEDAFCTYVPNSPPAHGVTVLYDTFSFRLTLPPRSRKLQFCVCFRCSGLEYWDNNFGKNYSIVKKEHPKPLREEPGKKISLSRRFSDDVVPNAQLDSWSEFASWNHLTNNTPYW
ncbi:UNVERIFIED_CONTAM: hypothetical protein PYX00_006981 [Menopon gallinae]|uniref:CBM21 domain-containing protein n=1 Tax=Menopon gallinae TaxID=328185 RepID=A0AAW2HHB6_9NEOP